MERSAAERSAAERSVMTLQRRLEGPRARNQSADNRSSRDDDNAICGLLRMATSPSGTSGTSGTSGRCLQLVFLSAKRNTPVEHVRHVEQWICSIAVCSFHRDISPVFFLIFLPFFAAVIFYSRRVVNRKYPKSPRRHDRSARGPMGFGGL